MYCKNCGKDIGTKKKCPSCGIEQHGIDPFVALGDIEPNKSNGSMEGYVNIPSAKPDYFSALGDLEPSGDCFVEAHHAKYDPEFNCTNPFHSMGNMDGSLIQLDGTGMDAPATGGFKPMDPLNDDEGSVTEDEVCHGDRPATGGFKPMEELVPSNDGREESEKAENPNSTVIFVWKKWMTVVAVFVLVIVGFLLVPHFPEDTVITTQARIEERLQADHFTQLSLSEKQKEVAYLVDELYEDGLIPQKAVYNEEHKLFTFQHADGTFGGISLQSFNETRNSGAVSTDSSDAEYLVSSHTGNMLEVIILNGFENTSFRRDYYREVQNQWQAKGINTSIDTLVTIEDLSQLKNYDVFIFSMHGSIYDNSPVLCLNEVATSATDAKYAKYLDNKSVAKVFTTSDFNYHYWVFPSFFTQCYNVGDLDGKVCWSESCEFFGDDGISKNPDTAFADALLQVSCEAVLGYRNSVGAVYSRNVMKYSLDCMFLGTEVQFALDSATVTQGHTDGWQDLSDNKREAYPLRYGNLMYIVTKPSMQHAQQQTGVSELFNETYWHMSFGQSLGYNYVAKFSADGTFVARGMGSGAYENGTYTYSNGKLVIVFDIDGFGYPSTIEYSGNEDGFSSLDKYPMQVGEEHYTINPSSDGSQFFKDPIETDPPSEPMMLSDGEYYGHLQSWGQNSATVELYEFLGWNEMYMYREFERTQKTVTLDIGASSIWLEWAWGETGDDIKCKSIDAALDTEIWGGGTTIRENCTMDIYFVVENKIVTKIVFLYAS